LVQVKAEPIKETIDHLRDALAWLGEPVVKQKKHNNTLVFKVQPTDMDAGEIHKVMFGICDLLESDLETALKEAQKVGAESCSYEGARGMMQQ